MTDWETIAGIYGGFAEARILHEAVLAGVFDLADEPRTASEVAAEAGLDPGACRLLLDALAGMELLDKDGDAYVNAEGVTRYLAGGGERTQVPIIRFNARQWDHWGRLGEALRTGDPVRPPDMYQDDPELLSDFIRGMESIAVGRGDAPRLPEVLDLEGCDSMLDIGGGPGTYCRFFLQDHPDLAATLFDLPATLEVAREMIAGWPADVRDRIELVAGDYHEDPLPGTHDLVWVSNIVHSETEKANRALMEEVHAATAPGGRVVVKDHILDETRTRPRHGATFAIVMLLFTGGRCYTFEEIRAWMEEAGFVDVRRREIGPDLPQELVVAERG